MEIELENTLNAMDVKAANSVLQDNRVNGSLEHRDKKLIYHYSTWEDLTFATRFFGGKLNIKTDGKK